MAYGSLGSAGDSVEACPPSHSSGADQKRLHVREPHENTEPDDLHLDPQQLQIFDLVIAIACDNVTTDISGDHGSMITKELSKALVPIHTHNPGRRSTKPTREPGNEDDQGE
jgi:hypothetical protein